jgi:nucleotide-binding universal stress UspA family protein
MFGCEAAIMTTTGEAMPTDNRHRVMATVPVTEARARHLHVLVATDGSPRGAEIARRGLALLDRPGRVTLLRVLTHVPADDTVDDIDDEIGPELELTPEQLAWHWSIEVGEARAELARTAELIGRSEIDERLEAGDVARTVCDVARELHVDMIVVGCHARSRLRRIIVRSVSEQVIRHAPCAVLVVPADATDDPTLDAGRQ